MPAKAPEAPEEAPEKYPAYLLLFAIVFNACHVHLCSKKKCFSDALRHTVVVLEMH